jgi:hypothetical protein
MIARIRAGALDAKVDSGGLGAPTFETAMIATSSRSASSPAVTEDPSGTTATTSARAAAVRTRADGDQRRRAACRELAGLDISCPP